MPLTLQADQLVELAWWWEDPPRGRLLELRDVSLVRSLVARWFVRGGEASALRRFLSRGDTRDVGRLEDDELFERIAVSITRGKIRVAITSREPLIAWDGEEEEAPSGERVIAALKEEVEKEDICWPCLMKAMASARTLIEAAQHGTPFITNGPLKEAPKKEQPKKEEPKKDDICWPCLRKAMASAQALIAAAKNGTPFIKNG